MLFVDSDRELGEILEMVAQLSVRLVFQAALEAEVTEFLGRDGYAAVSVPARGIATVTRRPPSRRPRGRSPFSARRSAGRWSPSRRGCEAST